MASDLNLLVGTTKGAFILAKDAARQVWHVSGPHCDGWTINHVKGDPANGRIWAGGGNAFSGAGIWRSPDLGKTWDLAKLSKGEIDSWMESDPESAAQAGWTPVETAFDGEVTAI